MNENLIKFENSIANGGMHNIYLLQTVDRSGNITGEAYGKNLMTDFGLSKIWRSNVDIQNIYVGGSDQSPTLDNKALYDPYYLLDAATFKSSEESFEAFQYNKLTHIYSCRKKIYSGYYDYNIDNLETDCVIKEFGYGSSHDNLIFHSNVFDVEGNKSQIVKHNNEKLIITFWICGCVNVDIIKSAYDQGQYMFISPAFFARHKGDVTLSLTPRSAYRNYKTNHGESERYVELSNEELFNTPISNHVLKGTISMEPLVFENKYDYVSSMFLTEGNMGDNFTHASDFFIFTFEKLSSPEELTTNNAYTNSVGNNYLNSMFASPTSSNKEGENYFEQANGELPVANFNIKSMKMYNSKTKSWDIVESFLSSPKYDFDHITATVHGVIYADLNGDKEKCYVYINPHNDLKILKIMIVYDEAKLYATDEYWDTDTYELIEDPDNIPEELGSKRYYILSKRFQDNISFDYDMGSYLLNSKTPRYDIYPSDIHGANQNIIYKPTRPCCSDDYEWIASYDELIYPNAPSGPLSYPISYQINSISDENDRFLRWTTSVGDKLILGYFGGYGDTTNIHNFQSFKIYDTTNQDSEPTSLIIKDAFDSSSVWGTETEQPYISWSNNGFLTVQKYSGNKCGVLDVYDSNHSYVLSDVDYCHALNFTDNCVYLKTNVSDKKTFEIFDMKNKSVVESFNLPSEPDSVNGIFGWGKYIYISTIYRGAEAIFFYDVDKHSASRIPDSSLNAVKIKTETDLWKYRTDTSVEDLYIISHAQEDTKFISSEDSKSIREMTSNKENFHHNFYNGHMMCQLKYINEGKQLIYAFSTVDSKKHNIIDMGQVRDGLIEKFPIMRQFNAPVLSGWDIFTGHIHIYKLGCITGFSSSSGLIYFPIETFINHQMTGTTTTITAYNDPFQISGKTYSISITNDMSKVLSK